MLFIFISDMRGLIFLWNFCMLLFNKYRVRDVLCSFQCLRHDLTVNSILKGILTIDKLIPKYHTINGTWQFQYNIL